MNFRLTRFLSFSNCEGYDVAFAVRKIFEINEDFIRSFGRYTTIESIFDEFIIENMDQSINLMLFLIAYFFAHLIY